MYSLEAVVSDIVVAGKCVPTNDTLSGPLAPAFTQLIGAANGLMPYFITGVAIVLAVLIVVSLRSDKAAGWLKMLAYVLAIPVILWFGLMLYFVVTGALVDVPACPF